MQYRRSQESGGDFFFTLVTYKRRQILTLRDNISRLRQAFRREIEKRPFEITAFVILPDHLHCIWKLPEGDHDYSRRWSSIKSFFSIGAVAEDANIPSSRTKKREKGVWQRRFWEHTIRDEVDWRRHMDYIHFNPVKHGWVKSPSTWPYSSFQQCVKEGLYENNWGASEPNSIKSFDFE